MAHRSSLKASDEDRERVTERLRHAAADGRLLAEELEQRLATALRARTYGELDAVVSDLPGDRPSRHGKSRPARGRRRLPAPSPLMLAGLVIAIPVILALVIAIAVVVLTLMIFWTVLTVVTWRLLGHRRALPGPWTVAAHRRRRIHATRRNAVSGFVPWL
jgi:hypothetical protein